MSSENITDAEMRVVLARVWQYVPSPSRNVRNGMHTIRASIDDLLAKRNAVRSLAAEDDLKPVKPLRVHQFFTYADE